MSLKQWFMRGSANFAPIRWEVPVSWLISGMDGHYHRMMFSTLGRAMGRLRLTVSMEETRSGRETVPRKAPPDGFTLSYHSIGEVKNVWRIKESAVPNYYLFDRCGYSGWAEIARYPERFEEAIQRFSLNRAREFTQKLRKEFITTNVSKYRQPNQAFEVESPFVFFPLQRRNDTVAKLYRLDSLEVLERAAALALAQRKLLVVKRHPHCREPEMEKALDRIGSNNPFVCFSTASIHRILPQCDAVLVANSGVGFEALVHGKPVYSFGASEYSAATTPVLDLSQLTQVFGNSHVENADYRDRFVAYFLLEYCFSSLELDTAVRKLKLALSECGAAPASPLRKVASRLRTAFATSEMNPEPEKKGKSH